MVVKVVLGFWRSWFHQLHFKPSDPKQFMRGTVKKKKKKPLKKKKKKKKKNHCKNKKICLARI